MNEPNLLRIIPGPIVANHFNKTEGTKVITSDGREVNGVIRVTLVAELGDVWRATIECFCVPPEEVKVMGSLVATLPPSWWRRALLRLAGVKPGVVYAYPKTVRD